MKRLFALILICISFLNGEEFISLPAISHLEEESPLPEKNLSQFVYLSGGMNPLPTIAIGYRKLYNSFGSDISLSGSLFPIASCGKIGVFPIPGVQYKQLFFPGKGWQGLKTGSSAFYLGAETGVYPLGDLSVNIGGLFGWQFKRKEKYSFFELGINPILYTNRKFSIAPLGSLTYAFMF